MKTQLQSLSVALVGLLLAAPAAHAQTGVSDDRVSLPEGPGSLSGLGDDVDIDPNMGQMSYSVPISAPAGFPGLTPSLAVRYSSGGGNSVVGMGWSMDLPSVERLTMRGVPRYLADDEFMGDGVGQLVYVGDVDGAREYRARVEGGFARYRWHDAGVGAEGYWTAELPDGFTRYYGATPDGSLVASARVGGPSGTFRYELTTITDVWGHELRYTWEHVDTTGLPTKIEYVFVDGAPQYVVELAYEDREDWISVANGGFEEVTKKRLAEITVSAHGTPIRRYALDYEPYAESGGFTRLRSVQLYGLGDVAYPAAATFHYSEALGQICGVDDDCDMPFVRTMGSPLGVNLGSGKAQLIDINGDGLPDIVDASEAGAAHRIFVNHLAADGTHTMLGATQSAVGTQTSFDFSQATVQVLDADGDGFTDVLNATSGQILYNRGGGDWDRLETATVGNALPSDAGLLAALRFMDYDGDRRIDLISSVGAGGGNVTTIFRNTAAGFVVDGDVDPLGAGFDSGALELNDFNGDGLLDAVLVSTSEVTYNLNLGWGRWAGWRSAGSVSFTDQQAKDAELEDINGDGMSDLVLVTTDTVRLWINRNGRAFDAETTLTSAAVQGSLPTREATTVVLFADMNGNGSSDVVWITPGGLVTYLELFPVKPNLLSRVENGLGQVTDVTYASSVEEAARDAEAGRAWAYEIPFPNLVVKSLDTWDSATGVHSLQSWDYHDGSYDGVEKQFYGYERVEQRLHGDDFQEGGETALTYEVQDFYNAGQILDAEVSSGGRFLQRTENTYDDCPVAGSWSDGALRFPIRFVCHTQTTTQLREGLAADDPAVLVLRQRTQYDGHGNPVEQADDGVISRGGSADCGACTRGSDEAGEVCGAGCEGDEHITTYDYVAPGEDTGGAWLLGLPWRVREYGGAGREDYQETLTYYDGEPFVGLPQGEATHGVASRVVRRVDTEGATVTAVRVKVDADGNIVEQLDALGEPGGDTHRRTYQMSDDGLRVVRTDVYNADATGPYILRRDYRYDPLWDLPSVVSDWRVVAGSDDVTPVTTTWTYDAFARVEREVQPGGDTVESPTIAYTYHIEAPVSWVGVKGRSVVGQPMDMDAVECVDGRGRVFQRRQRLDAQTWQVSAFTTYDAAGDDREVFQPYTADSGACDQSPPSGVLSLQNQYDALGRPIRILHPSNGGHAASRLVLTPGVTTEYDVDDEDPSDPHYDTPTLRRFNGGGQLVAVGRTLAAGDAPDLYTFGYDGNGNVSRVTDPAGNTRYQTYDLLGRLLEVVDPDRGTTTFERDALGNIVREENGVGDVVRRTYDGVGRVIEEWVDGDRDATLVTTRYDRAADCPADACKNAASRPVMVAYASPEGPVVDWQSYDVRGRLALLRRVIDGVTLDIRWTYDNANRPIVQIFPGVDRELHTSYGAADQITAVAGYVDGITFDDRGDISGFAFSNGTHTSATYDAQRRLVGLEVAGDAPILSYAYDRDLRGMILGITDTSPRDGGPSATAAYTYDALHRLIAAELDAGTAHAETVAYGYDEAENMTLRTSTVAGSAVNDGARTMDSVRPHAVTQAGGRAMTYDDAGRMLSYGARTFVWDGQDRIDHVLEGGKTTGRYLYGRDTERVRTRAGAETTWFLGPDFDVESGVASLYVRVGANTVARREYCDLATAFYSDIAPFTGDDDAAQPQPDGRIDAADAWLAFAAAEGIVTLPSGVSPSDPDALLAASSRQELIDREDRVTWLHRDVLGSVAAVTDAAGEVVESSLRYPYGAVRWSSTDSAERTGFTDQRDDAASGLVHFDLRDYSPVLGRWVQPDRAFAELDSDSIVEPWESFSAYAYTQNSPIDALDPSGADTARIEKQMGFAIAVYTWHYLRDGGGAPSQSMLKRAQQIDHALSGTLHGEQTSFRKLTRVITHNIEAYTSFLERQLAKASTVEAAAHIQGRIDDLHDAYEVATGKPYVTQGTVDLGVDYDEEVRITVGGRPRAGYSAASPDASLDPPARTWFKPRDVEFTVEGGGARPAASAAAFGAGLAALKSDEDAILDSIIEEHGSRLPGGRRGGVFGSASKATAASASASAAEEE